jgi:hypothetical protein
MRLARPNNGLQPSLSALRSKRGGVECGSTNPARRTAAAAPVIVTKRFPRQPFLMPDGGQHHLALRQADQARGDFYAIHDELEFIKQQLARLPTRCYIARLALGA